MDVAGDGGFDVGLIGAWESAGSFGFVNEFLLVFDYFWQVVGLFDPVGCFN